MAHCLFEQSGTFKNEFRKLGFKAYDYDILDDFGQTDFKIDLFAEINNAYSDKPSIFDSFQPDDILLAFFPCVRFDDKVTLLFRGDGAQQKKWSDIRKLEYSMKMNTEQSELYHLICKLFIVVLKRKLKMVVENPLGIPYHYLTIYFPIRPSVIDKDRTQRGDWYKKPTQYWFVNCKPQNNLIFEALDYVPVHTVTYAWKIESKQDRKTKRSMIHPQYASRFIREHILNADGTL